MSIVLVPRSVYEALNNWFDDGLTGEQLVKHVIYEKEEKMGFKKPYKAIEHLTLEKAIKIAAFGRNAYEAEMTTDEEIRHRFDQSTPDEQELIKWVLDTIGDDIEGVND